MNVYISSLFAFFFLLQNLFDRATDDYRIFKIMYLLKQNVPLKQTLQL